MLETKLSEQEPRDAYNAPVDNSSVAFAIVDEITPPMESTEIFPDESLNSYFDLDFDMSNFLTMDTCITPPTPSPPPTAQRFVLNDLLRSEL